MTRVVVFGSLNADIVVRADRLPAPGETVTGAAVEWHAGGKGANAAAAAAVAGAATTFIGCVGSDEHASRLVDVLSGFGVDVDVTEVDGPSGQAYITVDNAGENAIVVVPGANARARAADLSLGPGDVAVAVLEVPADAVLAFLRAAAPARRILNPTPVEHCTPELFAAADVVVVNEREYEALQTLDAIGAEVIVTLGSAGVRVGGVVIPAEPVEEVVDTTGAGDCFVGTLAARLVAGDDLVTAARAANAAAARSVTRPGAMQSYF